MSDGTVLCDLSMEVLAGHIWKRQKDPPGHRFARKSGKMEKSVARNALVSLLSRRRMPKDPVYCLTMPGLEWTFERQVLHEREHGDKVRHTAFYCIESDEAIYRAAMDNMPGINEGHLSRYEPPECATASYGNLSIHKFTRCRFEDYIQVDYPPVDFIWADFNGPLSRNRLRAIKTAWDKRTRRYLAVTLMKGRTHESISEWVDRNGGLFPALRSHLKGAKVEHAISYSDGTEMLQVCFEKP